MSKKFSIVRTIDFEKLDYEIGLYQAINEETNPYLFMNKDTVYAIISSYKIFNTCLYENRSDDCKGYYRGHKVFIDNDLEFGEVEIR